jgi:hypothetical protein
VDHYPEPREERFEKAGGMVLFARFVKEDKVLMLEENPLSCKVATKK